MESEMFVPTSIIGQVAKHFNHTVSSPYENNNIKKVYSVPVYRLSFWQITVIAYSVDPEQAPY